MNYNRAVRLSYNKFMKEDFPMNIRKTLALCAVLALIVSLAPLAAVAEGQEKIIITVSGSRSHYCDSWANTIMAKDIEERFGIVLDCREFGQDEWPQQKGLIFASGDIPDLFLNAGFSFNEAADWGSQGFLLPLNDLIAEYGENTRAVFAKNQALERLATAPDGNIYGLLTASAIPANMANRFWINEKWIANVGLEFPETLDELYTVMKAFQEQDANGNGDPNDEIPVSGRVLDEIILNALGIPTKSSSGKAFYLKDGVPTMIASDEKFKTYLEIMHQYYMEGLLDNATFVQTSQELNAKIAEGRVGAYSCAAPWLYESPETAWDYRYFGGLTSQWNDEKMIGASSGVNGSITTAVSAGNPYPERTFQLLDWFYSDEGSTYGFIGAENVGWKWVDEANGDWARVLPEGWTDTDEAYRGGVLTIHNGFNIYRSAEWKLFKPTGNNVWLYDQYTDYAVPYFKDVFPSVVLTEEELDTVVGIETDLDSYIKDAVVRFVIGEEDIDAGWDNFQNTMKNMQAEKYTQVYTNAYNRYMGN